MPVDPALARQVAQMARAQAKSTARAAHDPAKWKDRVFRALGEAPLSLDAVLLRQTLPLGQVESLVEGDLIRFDRSDLSSVTLVVEDGHVVSRGRLGQAGGRRAVRLGGDDQANGAASIAGQGPAPQSTMPQPAMPQSAMAQPAMAPPGGPIPNPVPEPAPMPQAAEPAAPIPDPAPMPDAAAVPEMAEASGLPDLPMAGGFDPDALME